MFHHALGLCAVGACCLSLQAGGGAINATYDEPTLDRWFYAFNTTPGVRAFASTFGAYGEPFDNRDGQFYLRFDTNDQVPTGLGVGAYQVTAVRLRVFFEDFKELLVFDPTYDPYGVFLPDDDPDFVVDEDPGFPMEVFGAGYRNGFTPFSFAEGGPYTNEGSPIGQSIRNVYCLGFAADGTPRDESNWVDEARDSTPWAIGQAVGLEPGDPIPFDTEFVFDLDVSDPFIHAYLANALNDGTLPLVVTSPHQTAQGGVDVASFYTRESGFGDPAALEISVTIIENPCVADITGDGSVGPADLAALLDAWGPNPGNPADLTGDGDVGPADLAALLDAWGPCP